MQDRLRTILQRWDLGAANCSPLVRQVYLVTTLAGQRYVLKNLGQQSRAHDLIQLYLELRSIGCAVPNPVPMADGSHLGVRGGSCYALFDYIEGASCTDHYGPHAMRQAQMHGSAIGELHRALSLCSTASCFARSDLLRTARTWALPLVLQEGLLAEADAARVNRALDRLAEFYPQLPEQLVHRDPHPSNMLFRDSKLVAMLDLDLAVVGIRLFDICYCGTSILMDSSDDPARRTRWPGLFAALVEGYESRCPLLEVERQAISLVPLVIQLIFAAYFLGPDRKGLGRDRKDLAIDNVGALLWLLESWNIPTQDT